MEYSLREAGMHDIMVLWQAIDTHRDYLRTWLPFIDSLQQVEDEEKFLDSVLSVPYEERNIIFIIEAGDCFAGLIGFVTTDLINHRTEIGYWLLPEFQQKGIMTKCVKQLCLWAIEKRNMNRIQIKCAVGNRPSNAIPQRLNFVLEGTERAGQLLVSGEYTDINVYSILKDEAAAWSK